MAMAPITLETYETRMDKLRVEQLESYLWTCRLSLEQILESVVKVNKEKTKK